MLSESNPNISFFSAGTLTQNEMVFKRLHLGTVSYGTDTMDEIQSHIIRSYAQVPHFTHHHRISMLMELNLEIVTSARK